MIFHRASDNTPAAVAIKATAFRDDRSAEQVTITELSFDRCTISSSATFETGEHLRLHLTGQGWIEAGPPMVKRASSISPNAGSSTLTLVPVSTCVCAASLHFVNECRVADIVGVAVAFGRSNTADEILEEKAKPGLTGACRLRCATEFSHRAMQDRRPLLLEF
jgi:hypothetical protein